MKIGLNKNEKGIALGEIILIALLISILSIIMVPRFFDVSEDAKWEACLANVANINALVQLYYIKEGTWPMVDLSDIAANVNYFVEQKLPDCPVTPAATYFIYPTGHRVSGHKRGVTPHP